MPSRIINYTKKECVICYKYYDMKMKILFLTNVNPFTASFGAEQRSYVFLQSLLQNGCMVDVVYFGTTIEDYSLCPPNCNVVYWNNGHQWSFSKIDNFLRLATVRMYPVCKEQEVIIDRLVVKNNYDYIACRYIPTASTAGLFKYADRLLLDIDDLPASAMAAQMGPDKRLKEIYHARMVQSVKNETKRWISLSKVCFLPNMIQAKEYKCVFMPNIPVYRAKEVIHDSGNKNILFIGLMSFRPNWEGVDRFIRNCWDKVIDKVPDAHFIIAGKGLKLELQQSWKNHKNIEILGFVENITEFYSKGNIVIVPVFSGAGTNIKVIEAMSMGKATVLSAFSTKGYEEILENGNNTYIANTNEEFSDRVIELLTHEKIAERFAKEGHAQAMRFYSQESINRIVEKIIRS